MWPWEHAALGYLLYSFGLRVLNRAPPTGSETSVLVVATVLPDLVDKPLAWGLGWFPSGFAVAHSIFAAIPLGLATLMIASHVGRRRVGIAFVVGYGSHLVGDVMNPLRSGGRPILARVLWPLSDIPPYDTKYGLGRGLVYFEEFVVGLSMVDPLELVILYIGLPVGTITLWWLDGAPGVELFKRALSVVYRRLP